MQLTVIAFTTEYKVVPVEKYIGLASMNNESTYASYNALFAQLRYMMRGWGFQNSILVFFLTIAYYILGRKIKITFSIWNVIFGSIFALLFVLGKCYQDAGTISFVYTSWKYFLVAVVFLFSIFTFFYCCLEYLYYVVEHIKNTAGKMCESRILNFFDNKPFIASFMCMCVSRLPYLVFFYPGIVSWDAMFQLDSYYGVYEWTTHHPPLSTLLIVFMHKMGILVGKTDNIGVFFYVFIQVLIEAFIIAYCITILKKWGISIKARLITIAYFSLFTVWGIYSVTVVKDSLYYMFFLLWYMLFIKMYNEKMTLGKSVLLIGCSLIVILLRKNGLYIVIPSLLMLGFKSKAWKKCIGVAIMILMCSLLFDKIVWSSIGIADNTHRDEFAMLFQQTARYVKEYPEDVTSEEKKILEKILVYDKLAERYNPDIADPVKSSAGTQIAKLSDKEIKEYLQVWIKQLKRHPLVYIEAFLNGTYRYWYPDAKVYNHNIGQYFQVTDPVVDKGFFSFSFMDCFSNIRVAIYNISYILYKMPFTNIFYCPATYTWLLIFIVYYIMRKREYRYIILAIPVMLATLINLVSPVNGYLRYTLPIMATIPVLLSFVIYKEKG